MRTTLDVDRSVEAVERACTSAGTADELLEAVAGELHRLVPHDGSAFFGVDPVTLLGTAPSRVEALDPDLCDTFWHLEFHEQDIGLFADLARDEGATAMRLALEDRIARSPRYRDFLAPQGYADELRAVFRSGESVWGMVGLYRESAVHGFTEEEVAVVKAVGRPVADSLRRYVLEASPWLGQPSAPGLLIVDRQSRVVSANQDALCWLRDLWPGLDGLRDEEAPGGRLVLRNEGVEGTTTLSALVSRARAVAAGRERAAARLRLRDVRGRWVVLHASTLSGTDPDGDAAGRADDAVAVVIEAAKSAEIAPIIIDAYGLTARERQVLGAIARGGSTAEIAAELFLSQHTVRDHIKTVFEKVGVSSRGELVARIFGEHYADRLHETMVHD